MFRPRHTSSIFHGSSILLDCIHAVQLGLVLVVDVTGQRGRTTTRIFVGPPWSAAQKPDWKKTPDSPSCGVVWWYWKESDPNGLGCRMARPMDRLIDRCRTARLSPDRQMETSSVVVVVVVASHAPLLEGSSPTHIILET
jgi:hypothetical protein